MRSIGSLSKPRHSWTAIRHQIHPMKNRGHHVKEAGMASLTSRDSPGGKLLRSVYGITDVTAKR